MRLRLSILFMIVIFPVSALANMANPERPGDVVGELTGDVSRLAIERETLTFDLEDVAQGQPGTVEALYQIRNDHGTHPLELQFITVNLAAEPSSIAVEFDDQPVEFRVDRDAPIPEKWKLEEKNDRVIATAKSDDWDGKAPTTSLFFDITIPPGRHEIRVSYPVEPWENTFVEDVPRLVDSGPQRFNTYMVPYVLAPAREWGDFGTLEVEVRVPARWRVATSPKLENRTQNILTGTFDSIPADGFYIRMKPRFIHSLRSLLAIIVAVLLLLALIAFLPIRLGTRPLRRFAKVDGDTVFHTPMSIGVSVILLGVTGLITVPLVVVVHGLAAGGLHIYPGWGYALFFMSLVGIPAAAILSLGLFAVSIFATRRRIRFGATSEH